MDTDSLYQIEMLGGLRVRYGDREIARFRTQKTGLLLAYMACRLSRSHAREELIELLWPEGDPDSGRTNLRTALASLRRQIEPPGIPAGSILVADRYQARLNPDVVSTDVSALESAAQASIDACSSPERLKALSSTVALYHGPFLPGFYEDWVLWERERLQALYIGLLRDLVALERTGNPERAIDYAYRALAVDPCLADIHAELMRLYAETGQPASVRRQYRDYERIVSQELGSKPSEEMRSLRDDLLAGRPSPSLAFESQTGEPARPVSIPPPDGVVAVPVDTSEREPRDASRQTPDLPPPVLTLPLQTTRFFGRETETARLMDGLRPGETRLWTLTGPGGAGKTRIAVEVARRLAADYAGAVWFVALADVKDADHIPDTIARTLSLSLSAGESAMERVIEKLSRQPSLLILDNFEHLAETGIPCLMMLLERTPSLACLVTSRQRLDLESERHFPLSLLPVPELSGTPEFLVEYPSVGLFVDRAQAVRPDFQITRENAPAVASLCKGLEGLPLALELTAAWAQTLTPSQMCQRLTHRFDLLTSRRRDLSPRHRTLRGTLEWSYHLLEPPLQRFFARLSVFGGGWTMDAAEKVCFAAESAGESLPADGAGCSVLEMLQQLSDRSLVTSEDTGDEMRFRMLEAVREFAGEQLSGEERAETEHRHLLYYLRVAETARPYLDGPEQAVYLDRLEREHGNFRTALDGVRDGSKDAGYGLRLAAKLHFFWVVRGHWKEGYRRLTEMLTATGDRPGTTDQNDRIWALNGAGEIASALGDAAAARGYFERSLALSRAIGDGPAVAYSLNYLGILAEARGDPELAHSFYEDSLRLWREIGDAGGIAHASKCLGGLLLIHGDAAHAQALFEDAETHYRRVGNRRGLAMILGERGRLALTQGAYETATAILNEYLDLARELKDPGHTSAALERLGLASYGQGDYPRARACFEENMAIVRETGRTPAILWALDHLAALAAEQGDYRSARKLYRQGLDLARECDDRTILASLSSGSGRVACHVGDYDAARHEFEKSLRLYRELDDQRGIVTTLRYLGNALAEEGDLAGAREAHGECLELSRRIGDRHAISMALYDLGMIARLNGDAETARAFLEESLSLDRAIGVKGGRVLGALGSLAADRGEISEAARLWQLNLLELREIGDRKGTIECLEALAEIATGDGRTTADGDPAEPDRCGTRAARLFGAAEAQRKAIGSPLSPNRKPVIERCLSLLRERLGQPACSKALTEGRVMTLEQAEDLALGE